MQIKRKGVVARLRPVTLEGVRCLYVDVNSVAAALKNPEELFRSMANIPGTSSSSTTPGTSPTFPLPGVT